MAPDDPVEVNNEDCKNVTDREYARHHYMILG